MSYQVLARKYRPQNFEEVVGQEAVAKTLQHAIEKDRLAQAYLFAGMRGVGKTTLARIFAKAINCAKGPTAKPCGQCQSCLAISRGDDLDVLEIDAASNRRIEEVRDLRQNVKYAPARSRFKVYIIDEVHMLTPEAFNALLKTLEEPPSHVKFVLATTGPEKVPETIRSRCQRFDLKAISEEDIVKRLGEICRAENLQVEPGVLEMLSRRADGSLRDAISLVDQVASFCEGKITLREVGDVLGLVSEEEIFELLSSLAKGQVTVALAVLDRAISGGKDVSNFISQSMATLRDLMIYSCGESEAPPLRLPSSRRSQFESLKTSYPLAKTLYFLRTLSEAFREVRFASEPRLVAELALVKLAKHSDLEDISTLLSRLSSLEEALEALVSDSGKTLRFGARPEEGTPPQARFAGGDLVSREAPPAAGKERGASGSTLEEGPAPSLVEGFFRILPEVWEELNSKNMRLRAFLREGRVLEVERERILIGFGRKNSFHLKNVSEEENCRLIEEAFSRALGREVRVTFRELLREDEGQALAETQKEERPEPPRTEKESYPKPSTNRYVEEVLRTFGGEPVEE